MYEADWKAAIAIDAASSNLAMNMEVDKATSYVCIYSYICV